MHSIQKHCSFAGIFSRGNDSSLQPARPIACARSDFDGTKWWTTWSRANLNDDKPQKEVLYSDEIDGFQNDLMSRDEMRNLENMKEFCLSKAEPTRDPTEFNLYSETEHFNVWIRLITRFKDYNLYVRFYAKEPRSAQ